MYSKAEEMVKVFQLAGKDYSIWDLLCLASVTLITAAQTDPELKEPIKTIVGALIDGSIILKSSLNDGILSVES